MALASTSRAILAGPNDIGTSSRRKVEHTVEDMVVEILLKLPVKSLVRFKCVCKGWYDLIVSPSFIAMHYSHKIRKKVSFLSCLYTYIFFTSPISFQIDETRVKLPVPAYVDRVTIVGCSCGVVCLCISSRKNSFALWNPATGNFREIGYIFRECGTHISDGLCGFACFLDATGINFKVAQVSYHCQKETRAQVKIFSSSSNSWSEKKIDFPCHIEGTVNTISRPCCVNWDMYWHITTKPNGSYLICFDMMAEVYKQIDTPYEPINDKVHLAGYRESLAMLVHRETYIDIWVMSDCIGASQSWSKLLTLGQYINVTAPLGIFTKDGADSVVLKAANGYLYLYDLETGEIKKLWEAARTHVIFQYKECLALLK